MRAGIHPEVVEARDTIAAVMVSEEGAFFATVARGLKLLEKALDEAIRDAEGGVTGGGAAESGAGSGTGVPTIDGGTAFLLYDSLGFPLDLTMLVAQQRGCSVDVDAFHAHMDEQRRRARSAANRGDVASSVGTGGGAGAVNDSSGGEANSRSGSDGDGGVGVGVDAPRRVETLFTGYDVLHEDRTSVMSVEEVGGTTSMDNAGTTADPDTDNMDAHMGTGTGGTDPITDADNQAQHYWMALTPCPFFPRGGGQDGDRGHLTMVVGGNGVDGGTEITLPVVDTMKRPGCGTIVVRVVAVEPGTAAIVSGWGSSSSGSISGSSSSSAALATVRAVVDQEHRQRCSEHHSATHLLHAALRTLLGPTVMQAGSEVGDGRLRFDFTHPGKLDADAVRWIEGWVNDAAAAGEAVITTEETVEDAKAGGAVALFGERYGSDGDTVNPVVRVVDMAGLSKEICGGTHVRNTVEVRPFKIVREAAVAAGTRRVEAVAGAAAVAMMREEAERLKALASRLGSSSEFTYVADATTQAALLVEREKQLRVEVAALRRHFASQPVDATLETAFSATLPAAAMGGTKKKKQKKQKKQQGKTNSNAPTEASGEQMAETPQSDVTVNVAVHVMDLDALVGCGGEGERGGGAEEGAGGERGSGGGRDQGKVTSQATVAFLRERAEALTKQTRYAEGEAVPGVVIVMGARGTEVVIASRQTNTHCGNVMKLVLSRLTRDGCGKGGKGGGGPKLAQAVFETPVDAEAFVRALCGGGSG